MSHVLADLKAFSKMYMRNKGAIFFTFILPILLIVLFGAMFSNGGVSTVSLPVQNLDGGSGSILMLNILNHTGAVKIVEVPATYDLNAYIVKHSLSLALQIPANFTGAIGLRVTDPAAPLATVSILGDPSKSTYQFAQGAVQATLDAMNFNLSKAQKVITMNSQGLPNAKGFNYMDFFLPGVIGMTIMTTSFYTMTSICASYRSRGYFKLLSTTTIQKYEWLLTKFIFMGILLTGSLLTTYAVGVVLFGMHSSLTPLTFVFIWAGALLFVGMGMLLGAAIKDPESGAAISNMVGFPMMFLSGSFMPIDSMPSFVQDISKALPLTYLNDGLRDTMVYGNNASALVCLGIVLALGAVVAIVGSRIMSWKEE